ncbi:LAGLIDADG family homing endonuclease [Geodermatophilus sp. SYSU D00691]
MLLPTPTGWTTLGDLRAGDAPLTPTGRPVTMAAVSAPFDVEGFLVTLASGEHFDVGRGQWWPTGARGDRRGGRLTTEFLARRVTEGADERPIYCVPITEPLQLPDADLPIEPYVLGAWLGDGDIGQAGMTSGDDDREFIRGQFHAAGFATVMRKDPRGNRWGVNGLHRPLRENGLFGNKRVPAAYLRGSHQQRLALFQGLMDTDGTISREGQAMFASTLRPLADAALELARALGLKARMHTSRARLNGVDHGPC